MTKKRISLKYVLISIAAILLCSIFITVHKVYKMKYGGMNRAYTNMAVKELKEGSFESFMAHRFLSDDEIKNITDLIFLV